MNSKQWTVASLVLGLCVFAPSAVVPWPALALAAGVQARFELQSPAGGPFPSDRFTVAHPSHNTGLRVHLPKPDCAARPSDCADLDVINTLDGFNLQPRLSLPFSGPIKVNTVTSATVFLVSLGSTVPGGNPGGQVVGINQIVWDPATNTLHAESDALLAQHTRYALLVTRGVRDVGGAPVEASEAFARFRHELKFGQTQDPALKAYRKALLTALAAARRAGVPPGELVAASVFTTQSATAELEKIRDQLKAATPAPADFLLAEGGTTRTVFPLATVAGVTFTRQTGTAPTFATPPDFTPGLKLFFPGAVGQIAFGKYRSPDYETAAKVIPPVGTLSGTPLVQGMNEIFFNLYLPSGTKPVTGWPVAIFGHAVTDSKQGAPLLGGPLRVAAAMAAKGIATIAINAVGHGGGPLSTLTVNRFVGAPVTFSAGGRSIDQNSDGTIDSFEGSGALSIVGGRDGLRQTVVDLLQLVREIQVGMDVDGDTVPELDPSRIYYFGQSLGGFYGTLFLAVEPDVHVGVPNVAGGPPIELLRLAPAFRPFVVGLALLFRVPSLINVGGPTGVEFNENLPLRNQPPVINTVPGATAIQEVIENTEWVQQAGNPVAYAPHLRKAPLDGVPAKSVIYQFARGDQFVPNPTTTAILRAGDLADRATFFRYDLAFAANPAVSQIPLYPHTFLTEIFTPLVAGVALGAQQQIAEFFASEGAVVIDPDGPGPLFEVPIVLPMPEDLGFLP